MKTVRKIISLVLALALLGGISAPLMVKAKTEEKGEADCKTLCGAALKATGGSKKLKYSSASAMDFGALSSSARKKVKSIQYVCDAKEVYSLWVMTTKNTADAKSLLNTLKKYKKRNCSSNYLSDYSATERKVFKNAVCGRKGTCVWYISMSPKKGNNTKGQTALKKKL